MGMPLHPSGGVAPYNPNPYPGYPGQSAQSAQQAQYNMTRNYKTVPCKYFHRYICPNLVPKGVWKQ